MLIINDCFISLFTIRNETSDTFELFLYPPHPIGYGYSLEFSLSLNAKMHLALYN